MQHECGASGPRPFSQLGAAFRRTLSASGKRAKQSRVIGRSSGWPKVLGSITIFCGVGAKIGIGGCCICSHWLPRTCSRCRRNFRPRVPFPTIPRLIGRRMRSHRRHRRRSRRVRSGRERRPRLLVVAPTWRGTARHIRMRICDGSNAADAACFAETRRRGRPRSVQLAPSRRRNERPTDAVGVSWTHHRGYNRPSACRWRRF
jgi:hypothetical protein